VSAKPSTTSEVDFPSTTKNDAITTSSPASGPSDTSMPPVSTTTSWPKLMKASAASSVSIEVTLKLFVTSGLSDQV
jgi:hypothetical protein